MTTVAESPASTYAEACTRSGCRPNKTLSKTLAALSPDTTLQCVDLSINVVGKNGANAIVDLVASVETVGELLVRDNYLSNENVIYMVQRLAAHPSLHRVDLRNNPISHAAGKALLRFVHANRRVTCIELEGTLINRALIRMICSAAEANAQAPPTPEKAAKEENSVGVEEEKPSEPDTSESPATAKVIPNMQVLNCIAATSPLPPAVACILASAGLRRHDSNFSVLAALQVSAAASPSLANVGQAPLNALWEAAFYPKPAVAASENKGPAAEENQVAAEEAPVAAASSTQQAQQEEAQHEPEGEAVEAPRDAPVKDEPAAGAGDSGLALILETAAASNTDVSALACLVEGSAVARKLPLLAAIAALATPTVHASVQALLDAAMVSTVPAVAETATEAPAVPESDAPIAGPSSEPAAEEADTTPVSERFPHIAALAAASEGSENAALVEASRETPRESTASGGALSLVLRESSSEHAGLGLLTSLL
jgi:hypothetical protein